MELAPVCGSDGEPTAFDVTIETDAWDRALPPVFRVSNEQNAEAARRVVHDPHLTDEMGEIPLTADVSAIGADPELRLVFRGARAAKGKLVLRYRALSVPTAEKGIRFGLRHDASGLGGSGDGFLVLPAISDVRDLELSWRGGNCKPDLVPSSALGAGMGPHRYVAPPDALRQAGFFFGRPETFAFDEGATHLRFSFFGRPAFDTRGAARYAADVLAAEQRAFGDEDETPFYAFMRMLPAMGKSVVGGGNPWGYSSVVGPEAPWSFRMRNHIAHELLHHWIGVGLWIEDERKVSGYWFSEGFTVHYAHVIPLRVGLISPAEVLEHVNKLSMSYFANRNRNASNAEMESAIERGGVDPAIGLMPYWRGALYAAELDAAIREASRGARSLDDVMRSLRVKAKTAPRNGAGYRTLPESFFRDLVSAELGGAGADRFDAVVRRGEPPRPPSGALGPCFERRDLTVGEYDLGFDAEASSRDPKTLRGLVPGSAAEKAGLAEGDLVVDVSTPEYDPTREVVVRVTKKDGQSFEARYLPARPGTSLVVPRWIRVDGLPDSKCGGR